MYSVSFDVTQHADDDDDVYTVYAIRSDADVYVVDTPLHRVR